MSKRREPRFKISLSAEIERLGRTVTAETRNMSLSGANLVCHHPFQEGESFQIGLFLVVEEVEDPTKPPLVCRAKVAWVTELEDHSYSAGVQFEDMTPEQKAWLERFLKEVEPT